MKERIACVVATYHREKLFFKNLSAYARNVTIPTDMFIINDYPSSKLNKETIERAVEGTPHRLAALVNHKINKGWSSSVREGYELALEQTKANYILSVDDDCTILKNCVERLVAVAIQEPKFGHLSSSSNYKRFWRDWTSTLVKFYVALGVVILHSRSFLEVGGNWDSNLSHCADAEMSLRSWDNGFWSAAVFAPMKHRRSGEHEIFNTESRAFNAKKVERKYPHLVKTTKDGKFLRKFDFPPFELNLNLKTLTLTRKKL